MASTWDIPLLPDTAVPKDRSRFLRLHALPERFADSDLHGTVVIIHGGYFKSKFGLDDEYGNAGTISLAPFFLARGFGAVELEYRRCGHEGGGWSGTNEDVLAAVDCLENLRDGMLGSAAPDGDAAQLAVRKLRLDRLVLVGHSAGGCLALWAAHALMRRAPTVKVAAVAALAPVADLVRGQKERLSDDGDAIALYMGGMPDTEEGLAQYARASPQALLPVTFPTLIAYGDKDTDVPAEYVAHYARDAQAGAPELVSAVRIPEADHFHVVNASSDAWCKSIVPALAAVLEKSVGPEAAAALRG